MYFFALMISSKIHKGGLRTLGFVHLHATSLIADIIAVTETIQSQKRNVTMTSSHMYTLR